MTVADEASLMSLAQPGSDSECDCDTVAIKQQGCSPLVALATPGAEHVPVHAHSSAVDNDSCLNVDPTS